MDTKQTDQVVTRFAPSPTGYLHIGSARTALFAYLFARKHHGTFILRIEDTDKNREIEGSIAHIIESLRWLGMDWDHGPDNPGVHGSCLQSDRLDIYRTYAEKLLAKGLAYPDPYSEVELETFREEAQKAGRPFLFRDHRPPTFTTWDGTQPLRFLVPEIKRYEWHDAVRGKLTAGPEMLDDFILIKSDGYPTYNFAHIVDDLEMGVTHVMRGEEFISSTPKFLSLYDALAVPYPIFATLPPIMGPSGKKKLSKRDGAMDVLEYRSSGYLPEAMRNFLALIGWNPGHDEEILSTDELLEKFSLEKIQRSGGAFNEEKLQWMNKKYLEGKSTDFKLNYLTRALPEALKKLPQYSTERLAKLLPVVFERIHNQSEITESFTAGEYDYLFDTPNYEVEILKWKKDETVKDCLPRLEEAQKLLSDADFSSVDSIKSALWSYAEEVGRGELLWPLRTALSGRTQSPDPFTIAYILGSVETVSRLQTACGKIKQ